MKEDILEQLADDYLQAQGYFTRHNIKYRPDARRKDFIAKKDSVPSDIDVLGFNPTKRGYDKVIVVSCKSWQDGFNIDEKIEQLTNKEDPVWKRFRELTMTKWSQAFCNKVHELTGTHKFTYATVVTLLKGQGKPITWEQHKPFKKALNDNKIKILTLNHIIKKLSENKAKTPAGSDIGRLLQLMRASGYIGACCPEITSPDIDQ